MFRISFVCSHTYLTVISIVKMKMSLLFMAASFVLESFSIRFQYAVAADAPMYVLDGRSCLQFIIVHDLFISSMGFPVIKVQKLQ